MGKTMGTDAPTMESAGESEVVEKEDAPTDTSAFTYSAYKQGKETPKALTPTTFMPAQPLKEILFVNYIGTPLEVAWYKRVFSFLFYEPFVVLWDYGGLKPDEITVERGRLVYVKNERYMSGRRWRWAWVQVVDTNKEGYIPSAYLIPQSETLLDTYRGDWYLGKEDLKDLHRYMEESDCPVGTFAVCKIPELNLNAGDQYAIVVRVREKVKKAVTEKSVLESGRELQGESEGEPMTVGVYKVCRDSHLRYFVNPGNPSPNLYSLISRLKSRPITIPVRLQEPLALRPGELGRSLLIPAPPPHPTRVPLDVGPSIDMMTNEEKRELLRPYGVKSIDIVLGEEMGRGNFGMVYKGKWKRAKQADEVDVALKVLRKKDREQEQGFREEALIMAKLDHPNVISFFGYDDIKHTLVMELLENGSLEDFLHRRRHTTEARASLEPRNLLDILYQVACGMAHVESQHFVHRDLAARNCLLGLVEGEERRIIKICDFGKAAPLTGELQKYKPKVDMEEWWDSHFVDYPWRWMAIESLKHKSFSHKSDVWSFGVLIQEVWTLGGQPYGLGETWLENPREFISWLDAGNRMEQDYAMPPSVLKLQRQCMAAVPAARPYFSDIHKALQHLLSSPEFSHNIEVYVERMESRLRDLSDNESSESSKYENA